MKKLLLLCFGACITFMLSAQKVYFLYLQTDDQAPFYVRMTDKIYSSAASGYLVLPNLLDSTYHLSVGFAKSTLPETKFAVTIRQNDKGYLIKQFDDGYNLFDLQDLSIVRPFTTAKQETAYQTKSDKFSSILSKAADDPGLLKVAVEKKEEAKPLKQESEPVVTKVETPKAIPETSVSVGAIETANNAALPDSNSRQVAIPKIDTLTTADKINVEDSGVQKADFQKSNVLRYSESSTTEGFGVVYFDAGANRTDTIRILIPPSKIKVEQDVESVNLSEVDKKKENTVLAEDLSKPVAVEVIKNDNPSTTNISSNCANLASDKDFLKLRKSMAGRTSDDAMIGDAKKAYKNKCFTAEQFRYLSTLFLSSAAKYQFFDASYNHVADKENFAALQSEIKDEYYSKRFKALIGE